MQIVYRVPTASHIWFTKLAPISCPLGYDALVVAVACRIVFNINIGPPRWYCHTGHYECMLRSSHVPSLDFDLGRVTFLWALGI